MKCLFSIRALFNYMYLVTLSKHLHKNCKMAVEAVGHNYKSSVGNQ